MGKRVEKTRNKRSWINLCRHTPRQEKALSSSFTPFNREVLWESAGGSKGTAREWVEAEVKLRLVVRRRGGGRELFWSGKRKQKLWALRWNSRKTCALNAAGDNACAQSFYNETGWMWWFWNWSTKVCIYRRKKNSLLMHLITSQEDIRILYSLFSHFRNLLCWAAADCGYLEYSTKNRDWFYEFILWVIV